MVSVSKNYLVSKCRDFVYTLFQVKIFWGKWHAHYGVCVCVSQRKACEDWFSPPTLKVLGIKLWSSGLAACSFTYGVTTYTFNRTVFVPLCVHVLSGFVGWLSQHQLFSCRAAGEPGKRCHHCAIRLKEMGRGSASPSPLILPQKLQDCFWGLLS